MRIMERIIAILLGIIMIASGAYLMSYGLRSYQNKSAYEELEDVAFPENESEDDPTVKSAEEQVDLEEDSFKFQLLSVMNPDCIGWISIPETGIDYPIMQAEDNDFYLHRDFEKAYAACGSIFMDYRNDIALSQEHLILYGHQMKDGSMFKQLNSYKDKAFYEEHPKIILHLKEQRFTYQIAGVYITNAQKSGAYYNYLHKESRNEQMEYLQNMAAYRLYETDTQVSEMDELLSLSTCEYSSTDGRLIVLAVRSLPKKED